MLVRTNDEAAYIQEALGALQIHSVLYSTANVFDSHEALEMDRVLAGIAEPNRESLLRAALATDMLGLSGEALERLTSMRPPGKIGWPNSGSIMKPGNGRTLSVCSGISWTGKR